MRSIVHVTLLLASLVAAAPYAHPQDDSDAPDPAPVPTTIIADPTVSVPLSTSLNVPTTSLTLLPTWSVPANTSAGSGSGYSSRSTRHHFSHWEPIPIFQSKCDCPNLSTVLYPCWASDALQRCNFEELHSFVCWTSAERGCPTPTRKCDQLYSPTPLTRNPCDLAPNPGPDPTSSSLLITELPTVTAAPSASATATATGLPERRWQDMAWNPEYYGVRK